MGKGVLTKDFSIRKLQILQKVERNRKRLRQIKKLNIQLEKCYKYVKIKLETDERKSYKYCKRYEQKYNLN